VSVSHHGFTLTTGSCEGWAAGNQHGEPQADEMNAPKDEFFVGSRWISRAQAEPKAKANIPVREHEIEDRETELGLEPAGRVCP
jgi:hypothetical protein